MLSNSIALIAVAAMFGVEAYKAKERLPRLVLATLAVVSALWGVLVEAIAAMAPKVGAIVTATFAQPSSWFVLLIALFFVLRPFWQSKVATPSASAAPASGQRGADSGEIENLKKRLSIEQDRSALTIARVEKLEGLPERVDALEALPATVGEMRVALENDIEALRAVANDSALQIQRIHPYLQEQARTLNERFSAVGDYVRLVTLEPEIRQYAASLDSYLNGGAPMTEENWPEWNTLHCNWSQYINEWLDVGFIYAKGVRTRTLTVNYATVTPALFSFSKTRFPNDAAVRQAKDFRVVHAQWQSVIPEVMDGVRKVAIDGFPKVMMRGPQDAE